MARPCRTLSTKLKYGSALPALDQGVLCNRGKPVTWDWVKQRDAEESTGYGLNVKSRTLTGWLRKEAHVRPVDAVSCTIDWTIRGLLISPVNKKDSTPSLSSKLPVAG